MGSGWAEGNFVRINKWEGVGDRGGGDEAGERDAVGGREEPGDGAGEAGRDEEG